MDPKSTDAGKAESRAKIQRFLQSTMDPKSTDAGKWVMRAIYGLVGLLLLMLAFGTAYTVSEQERAVVTLFGKASRVEGPGLHLKWPFAESVTKIDTAIQTANQGPTKANTYTIDNQELDAEFIVMFRIPVEEVMRVYQNVPDYRGKLQSLAFERFKREMGKVNVQDFAQHRGLVANNTLTTLKADANRLYGIEVIDFQISDVTYTKTYREAVEASATAKQAVQQAEQEKAHAQVVAETQKIQAEGKANAVIAAAKGDAAATLLNAEADSKQIRLKGEAEATAIRAQAEALRTNAALIELRKYEQWDGKLPASVGVGSAIPFIDVGGARGAGK